MLACAKIKLHSHFLMSQWCYAEFELKDVTNHELQYCNVVFSFTRIARVSLELQWTNAVTNQSFIKTQIQRES